VAGTAFTCMRRADTCCRAPDFAWQRVRVACIAVELAHYIPVGVHHLSFSMLDFDEHGVQDVQRVSAQ
jgi:hypothetical protein